LGFGVKAQGPISGAKRT